MEIIDRLFLSLLFALLILLIIVIGILVTELFKRRKDKRGIWYFIILYLIIGFKLLLDNYVHFLNSPSELLVSAVSFLDIFPLTMSIIIFYSLWSKLDKRISFVIIIFIVSILLVNFSQIFFANLFLDVLNLVVLAGVNFGFYFLTIKFLIDTSGS